jgi:hypothetical protein
VQVVFENRNAVSPRVSLILLDWSCRESFHILDYLAKQTVPRNQYEVIWIEYYDRRAPQIDQKLKECGASAQPPVVDRWVIMGTPNNVYYHKHLMYNTGIVLSRGRILVNCDSDVVVAKTFVEAIIRAFEEEPNLVLHLDEVRNNNKRFYPFNYPSIDEVIGEGCINWENGKTTGLWDTKDILHTRNYGACMAALREDLIRIGGADEHIDYLGHICGPYDMTFRLINFGKKEMWHPHEFLYHVWHPGQAGEDNYLGPHDGRHMSTTALGSRRTGRVFPLVENPAVKMLRLNGDSISSGSLVSQLVSEETLKGWSVEELKKKKPSLLKELRSPKRMLVTLMLFKTFVKLLVKQFWIKLTKVPRQIKTPKIAAQKVINIYFFLRNVSQYNLYTIQQSRRIITEFATQNIKEFSIYGVGEIAEILYDLTFEAPVKVKSIYDEFGDKRFLKFKVLPIEACTGGKDVVVIASLVGIEEKVERLKSLGVKQESIVTLQ